MARRQCLNCGVFVAPDVTSCDVCGVKLPAVEVAASAAGQAEVLSSSHGSAPAYQVNSGLWGDAPTAADGQAEPETADEPTDEIDASASKTAPQAGQDEAESAKSDESSAAGAAAPTVIDQAPTVVDQAPAATPEPVVLSSTPSATPHSAPQGALIAAEQGANGSSPQSATVRQIRNDRQITNDRHSAMNSAAQLTPSAPSKTNGPARWVAEVWVDPEWFRLQQSPDQLPSPGVPRVMGLRGTRVLIGRPSPDQPMPDIDCVTDSGVSRRQAQLISDGIRWFLEDLGSSNGTFVGQVDRPLPTQPIRGRVEVSPHDRIYVGSWTRIVVRPALKQEAEL